MPHDGNGSRVAPPIIRIETAREPGSVAERIRALRKQAGLLQVDLGVILGFSRSHVAKIETGKDLPGREMLLAIATHFNVSLDWLSRGHGDMRPDRALHEQEALLLHAYRSMPEQEAEDLLEYMLKRAAAHPSLKRPQ